MLCFYLYISSLYFYTPPRPLSVHLILSLSLSSLPPSLSKDVQWMGVKLLELWRSVSGASPIKVISNSWKLPFDGRIIPFGSHSLTLNAAAPCKQEQTGCALRRYDQEHSFYTSFWTDEELNIQHSQLHALRLWIPEMEIWVCHLFCIH